MGTPLTIVLGVGRIRPKKSKILFEIPVFSTNKDRRELIGPKIIFSNVLDERRLFPPNQAIKLFLPQRENHPHCQGTIKSLASAFHQTSAPAFMMTDPWFGSKINQRACDFSGLLPG
jgi:hypothetical protein